MEARNIPVVLFIFKREKAVDIVKRIGEIQPKKIYILADYGRNDTEKIQAEQCRILVEHAITWECEVIKKYATKNIGVYENIAEGAKWVLQREKWAIFLEDDNLPETTFFRFCQEMLERYENDTRIIWICGTNYLGEYQPSDGVSYMFTRHMLPCGWASWSNKFLQFYDGDLSLCSNKTILSRMKAGYCNAKLFQQYQSSWTMEYKRIFRGERPISWDYQMDFAIKANGLYGISPSCNQIRNIGVDEYSTHGGTSFKYEMTRRFCGMPSYPLKFPLVHPATILTDMDFEKKIGKIMLYPYQLRIKVKLSALLHNIFCIPEEIGIIEFIKDRLNQYV